jgi:hypothetical protein
MSELLWFGPDPEPATCQHDNLQDCNLVPGLYSKKDIKVCLDCRKGFVEGPSNKVMVNGSTNLFDAPADATEEEVMKIACDVVGTYGEDINSIVVFEEEPKIKWKQFYFDSY